MIQNSKLQDFLAEIMQIKVMRMGGASAGILGAAGADEDVTNNLKRSAINFAREYESPGQDADRLKELAGQIEGFVKTLQITSTLSTREGDRLLDALAELVDKALA